MKDGVYFDLPEKEYHALERFSASGIKKILVSGPDFWNSSWMNPDRKEISSDAMHAGTAYHKYILEPDTFWDQYCFAFNKEDFPDALDKQEDLKAKCAELGLPVSGTKPVLTARLLEADSTLQIMSVLEEKHAKESGDKIEIKGYLYNQIKATGELIKDHPEISKVFKGGHSEVTILWTDEETGIPMKCRIDKTQSKLLADIKTFSNQNGMEIDKVIYNSMSNYGYPIQVSVYLDAIEYAIKMIGDKWVTVPKPDFLLVFCQSGDVSLIRGKKFGIGGLAHDYGYQKYRAGMEKFQYFYNKFGTDKWIDQEEITELKDEEYPLWIFG